MGEQIAAGATTQNIVEIPVVQEQVIVQEMPQVSLVERIQAPQVVDSFPLLEDFAATVQPHVISQEIPQVQVVERIQEPNVEPIEVPLHERVRTFTTEQIEHMPVSQIQEQSAVTDALSVSEEVATLTDMTTRNTTSTSTSLDELEGENRDAHQADDGDSFASASSGGASFGCFC